MLLYVTSLIMLPVVLAFCFCCLGTLAVYTFADWPSMIRFLRRMISLMTCCEQKSLMLTLLFEVYSGLKERTEQAGWLERTDSTDRERECEETIEVLLVAGETSSGLVGSLERLFALNEVFLSETARSRSSL